MSLSSAESVSSRKHAGDRSSRHKNYDTTSEAIVPSGSSSSNRVGHSNKYNHYAPFIAAYLLFGALHELSHIVVARSVAFAWWLNNNDASIIISSIFAKSFPKIDDVAIHATQFIMRALLGRYCLVDFPIVREASPKANQLMKGIILHSGWIFSWILACACHYLYVASIRSNQDTRATRNDPNVGRSLNVRIMNFIQSILSEPIVIIAAYVTAIEATSTDLFGFIPHHDVTIGDDYDEGSKEMYDRLVFFCGNFGIILINSSWINIDGGKNALDMMEKMVNVTMMRGAQSGGVVTFEPAHYGLEGLFNSSANHNKTVPILRGSRSRIVNAKRTDLSKGIRHKVVKDNCTPLGNLRGWNKTEFNSTATIKNESRLVRGFFGHTRFATSSKASFDGTHPHQWSPRRVHRFFPFQSASASKNKSLFSESIAAHPIPVEKFITHNGDFEFYKIYGKYYDTEEIQNWLIRTLHAPMPCTVDSAAIAGMMDLLRCQGCFALSARYAICFEVGNTGSIKPMDPDLSYPTIEDYEEIGKVFEEALRVYLERNGIKSLGDISCSGTRSSNRSNRSKALEDFSSPSGRSSLVSGILETFRSHLFSMIKDSQSPPPWVTSLSNFVSLDVEEAAIVQFVQATVNAFFDNDLLHSTRIFLENSKGSFGLCVTTTIDAHRQACFAAKGQSMSIAFYPRKGVICYASEQAAVKAGLNYELPKCKSSFGTDYTAVDEDAVRLDLNDVFGEICLLDWGYAGDTEPAISPPNQKLCINKLMGGAVNVVTYRQNESLNMDYDLQKRLVVLENNEFVKPLLDDSDDPVLADIQDIPRICANIQNNWRHGDGLNRMAAWNLAHCLRERLKGHSDGSIQNDISQVDILVTGCEVSLWVAEQFVSDLQKCFPKLNVKSVSSNKILGLFGQELVMPSIGFPFTQKTLDLKDPIVIIVSHSGGTFGPLACSNLLQSFSSSIFCVTSEWDTQVGKQLRGMYTGKKDLLSSRIFSTEVGVRPAEPCSVSVCATHQLLTNIFQHICLTIISHPHFCHITGCIVHERDLQTLERCNQENIKALEDIVGSDRDGERIHYSMYAMRNTEKELRHAGDVWAEHILESSKGYIMSVIYILVTVTCQFPIFTVIATAAHLEHLWGFFMFRFLDALVYVWLPQICIFILRMFQRRNLRHRMVSRTVVIGDPNPWVAQAAEAFLSKLFACSYSIAGICVISGNPADHLVHRHTHRIVRGTLLVCGRPDGRLTALTSLEASTNLSVNQASSIQSIGGTCESITIGHNRSKLPLSKQAITLKRNRPKFLCEQVLADMDDEERRAREQKMRVRIQSSPSKRKKLQTASTTKLSDDGETSGKKSRVSVVRSSAGLLGAYSNLEKDAKDKASGGIHDSNDIDYIINEMIKDRQSLDKLRQAFNEIVQDGSGELRYDEFIKTFKEINPDASLAYLQTMFENADINGSGTLNFEEFKTIVQSSNTDVLSKLSVANRDDRGLVQVQPSQETYFGEEVMKTCPPGVGQFVLSQSQHLSQELYESRIASMQRFVAMTVMFHQMGMRVQNFFPRISFGLLGYRMDRTHSILRVATTASPVSGADVRDRMVEWHLKNKVHKAVNLVSRHWKQWKQQKQQHRMNQGDSRRKSV